MVCHEEEIIALIHKEYERLTKVLRADRRDGLPHNTCEEATKIGRQQELVSLIQDIDRIIGNPDNKERE